MPLTLAITNEQKIKVTLTPTTASGNPATLDGVPTWTVTSGDATVEPAEDGMSAYLVSGSVGASNIEVSADADLGEGVRRLTDVTGLNVVPAEAAGLGLIAGEAEQK